MRMRKNQTTEGIYTFMYEVKLFLYFSSTCVMYMYMFMSQMPKIRIRFGFSVVMWCGHGIMVMLVWLPLLIDSILFNGLCFSKTKNYLRQFFWSLLLHYIKYREENNVVEIEKKLREKTEGNANISFFPFLAFFNPIMWKSCQSKIVGDKITAGEISCEKHSKSIFPFFIHQRKTSVICCKTFFVKHMYFK